MSVSPPEAEKIDPSKQRRYPRYPLDVRVSAKVFRPEAPIELWGRSIEFGQDGIGVTLTGELKPGEVATLELSLPSGGAPLKLRALVRYRDGLRHGFEFLESGCGHHASVPELRPTSDERPTMAFFTFLPTATHTSCELPLSGLCLAPEIRIHDAVRRGIGPERAISKELRR